MLLSVGFFVTVFAEIQSFASIDQNTLKYIICNIKPNLKVLRLHKIRHGLEYVIAFCK